MKTKFEPKWSVEECEGTYAVFCDNEKEDGLGCIWDRKRAEKICRLLNQNDKEAFDSLDREEDNEIYLKSMYIERQNAEYYELKKECEDLERRIVKSNNKLVKMEKEKDAEIAELKNEIDELNGQISEM